MVHVVNFEKHSILIPVMKQRRLSLSESSFYGNTTFKKNSICLSRRGHRLAWSRIPSLLKLLNLAEVLAWGAGGRGFKSHWPHCVISSQIGFIIIKSEINAIRTIRAIRCILLFCICNKITGY